MAFLNGKFCGRRVDRSEDGGRPRERKSAKRAENKARRRYYQRVVNLALIEESGIEVDDKTFAEFRLHWNILQDRLQCLQEARREWWAGEKKRVSFIFLLDYDSSSWEEGALIASREMEAIYHEFSLCADLLETM